MSPEPEKISFFFPSLMPLDPYLRHCNALLVSCAAAGLCPATMYGSGRSEKDALSRPIDVCSLQALRDAVAPVAAGFLTRKYMVCEVLWSPEFSHARIRLDKNTGQTRYWLSFTIELNMDSDESQRAPLRKWAADRAVSGDFPWLLVDKDLDKEVQLIHFMYLGGKPFDLTPLSAPEREQLWVDELAKLKRAE